MEHPTTYEQLYESVKNKTIVAGIMHNGEKHRFFISTSDKLCRFIPKSSRRGLYIGYSDISNYKKFIDKAPEKTEEQKLKSQYNKISKYKRMAEEATFTNDWIKDCKAIPDFETWKKEGKSLYQLGITTGNKIDGEVISLTRIAKHYPIAVNTLRNAIKEKRATGTIINRLPFGGYEMTISVEERGEGIVGYLSLEYKDCGNGYYYLLVNDENFIGYDVD